MQLGRAIRNMTKEVFRRRRQCPARKNVCRRRGAPRASSARL